MPAIARWRKPFPRVLPRGTFQQGLERAEHWLKKTPPSQVLMVDVAAARALRIYPIPSAERQASVALSTADEGASLR